MAEIDAVGRVVQRPMMRPRISTRFGLNMNIVDESGREMTFRLTEHDLAYLRLSIAEAEERLARERLALIDLEETP